MPIDTLIKSLPKCELHIHIEGSLEPELMFALARRNGISLKYASVEDLRRAYKFSDLQDFLDIYYQGMSVLITEQDFYDLAWAYLERAQADNVRHVEMFFDPQGIRPAASRFATVINGLSRAIADAGQKLGVHASLIMCFLRHLDEADAEKTLDAALAFKDRIVGVGLDSSEAGHPPSKFKHVFARARDAGFFCRRMRARRAAELCAGRRSTCSASRASITAFAPWKIRRWWPGWRTSKSRSPCARCQTCGCGSSTISASHPLKRMLDKGLVATVNS